MAGITAALIGTTVASTVGGAMNMASSFQEAGAIRQQGDIAYNEALLEADRVSEQGRQYKATQKMSYVMSGVSMAGSPMQVLQDTDLKIGDEIRATKSRGAAQRALAYTRASQTQTKGITGFLSSMTSTASTASNLYKQAKTGGALDAKGSQKNKVNINDVVDTGSWGGYA